MKRSILHAAALEYAARGWHVFMLQPPTPGDPKAGKAPISDKQLGLFNGKNHATTDATLINQWWSKYPLAGIGIAVAPSKLVVLDVDIANGKPGRQSLADLEQEHGPLPDTLTAITGSGGLHAYYTVDDALSVVATKIGFKPGLDLIVNGYVVAPPSLHASGQPYKWNHKRPPVSFPGTLAEQIKKKVQSNSISENPALAPEPIKEGGRNDALFRVGCALYDNGIGEAALKSALHFENQRRFQPPLDDDEVRRIAESVMRRVKPSRDVALGALVEEIAREAIANIEATEPKPHERAVWAREVGLSNPPPTKFYSTGFPQLDALIGGGFCTRQVFGIIGPPSAGKSAWVDSALDAVAKQVPALHVSTELPREELFVRKACGRLERPWRDGMRGLVSRHEMREAVADLNVKLMGCDDLDFADPIGAVAQEAVKLANATGVMPVIAIDYVQLLARTSDDRMRQKVGELTMHIRKMSQALDTAVLAVFSTGREFYKAGVLETMREANDPTVYLTAAKESGDIEFDCATIVFLDVDKTHEGQPKPARGAVARCRVGDIGFWGMRARLDVGRWFDDAAAATEVLNEKKKEIRSLAENERHQALVLDAITRLQGQSWRQIKAAISGMGNDKKDNARAELIKAGRVVVENVKSWDSLGRPTTKEVIRPVVPSSPGGLIPGL